MAKQSLASAYVQIIPSADGISGKLAEVMGGEAASAGKISGKSLGSALVGSLTKVVAAAGIGKCCRAPLPAALRLGVPWLRSARLPTRPRCRWRA